MRTMSKNQPENAGDMQHCPMFTTLNLIANKWAVRMFYSLLNAKARTMRFGELQKAMNGVSQRELTRHLREFEAVGIVSRKAYAEIPPRVEYTLTDLGQTLGKPIEALSAWAVEHGAALEKNRARFTKAKERG
jgi:DNA-binding HxlR family transcriptional regulator